MSDLIREIQGGIGAGVVTDIRQKYVDIGGDHAIAVAVVSGGGGGGDASAANQLTQIARLDDIASRLPAIAHSQPLTDAQLRATPLPVAVQAGSDAATAEVLSPADHAALAEWDLSAVSASDVVHVEVNRNQRTIALTLDPLAVPGYSEMRSLTTIDSPGEVSVHLSMSQRARLDVGTFGLVDRSATIAAPADIAIASIRQETTTCTIVLAAPFHGRIGQLIDITGVTDNRLWYQLAPVASISEDRLTLTLTNTDSGAIPSLTVGPFTGGTLRYAPDAIGRAASGGAVVFASSTATSAIMFAQSAGVTRLASAITSITRDQRSPTASTARQVVSGGIGHATGASSEFRIEALPGEFHFADRNTDAVSGYSARAMIESAALAVSRPLTPIITGFESAAMPRPVAKIVSVTRLTNVVTITLDQNAAAAGLAVGQYPHIYGVRDTANFADSVFSSTITAVAGNTVTVAWSGSNATSYGGAIALPAGGISQQGLIGVTVQRVTRNADDSLTVVGSATWGGLAVDDIAALVGVRGATTGADLGVDGLWRVSSTLATTLILRPVTDINGTRRSPAVVATASTDCGGAVLLATTIRVHSFKALERRVNEVRLWGQGSNSTAHALPVVINGSASLSAKTYETATLTPTAYALVTAATTNAAVVKSTDGNLFAAIVSNTTAATINVKLYNKATAPTVGTDVPLMTIPVAAGAHVALEYGRLGLRFGSGIGIAVTAAMAATDTAAVTAGAQVLLSYN